MTRRFVPSSGSILAALLVTFVVACTVTQDLGYLQSGACPAGTKACSDKCVSTNSPQTGCGLANVCSPCALEQATARCAPNGTCEIAACSAGWENCDGNTATGCEVQTDFDPDHCGSCGFKCTLPNATPGCASGSCSVRSCNAGFGNCDAQAANGCETDLSSDESNCGACGKTCNAGVSCVAGVCGGDGG